MLLSICTDKVYAITKGVIMNYKEEALKMIEQGGSLDKIPESL